MGDFTPGPWEDFDDYEVSVDAESNVGNSLAGWFVIGNPNRANGEVAAIIHFHGTDEAEYVANGRLIAAAPELLEALESAPIISKAESAEAFQERQNKWLREIYGPAINKARGK